MKKLFVLGFWAALMVAGIAGWRFWDGYQYLRSPVDPARGSGMITVPQGATFFSTLKKLREQKWITRPEIFRKWVAYEKRLNSLKAGEYKIHGGMTPMQIMDVLSSGVTQAKKLTVPEGYNLYQIAELLESKGIVRKAEFLRFAKDPSQVEKMGLKGDTFEGYLFPDTYRFEKSSRPFNVVSSMVRRFKEVWSKVDTENAHGGLNEHEILILASIIEKETGASWERPLISSVFHNRLKRRMLLATDPTVIYGLIRDGVYKGNLRKKHLRTKHPYNTYKVRGLPPGPIANPGKEAIRAAIAPKESDYLYFGSRNDGTHVFTKNYKAHKAAVQKFQKDPRARRGKSWRDLKKKTN